MIKGSNGSGNASMATVSAVRAPSATTIQVDTVLNIPTNFYASMGTPHTFTDPVTSETITVISEATAVDFSGHVDGSNLEIDAISPGYTDGGSAVGDVVIIKPTTQWANNIANTLAVSHNDDGTLKDDSVSTDAIEDNAITTPKINDGAVERAKLAPSVVRRKSSGASTDVTAPRIQCGWEVKAYASAGTIITPITFPDTFATIPIVTASFAGDAATNTGYGSGAINLANGVVVRVNSITTSGFTLSMTKADGTNFPSFGFSWLTWMAIGD